MTRAKQSGILVVDKPAGRTSHDVVDDVRTLTGVRRVGHAGTLDPLATGVLVVCVGRTATRIVEYMMGDPKAYRTTVQLGIVTDTLDREGEIVSRSPVHVDREDVRSMLRRFEGPIEQLPPMYSAVKHRGKPLYQFARRGLEVKRELRRVDIHRLELVGWEASDPRPRCTLEIDCSSGTYVRSLVHDLGQELGCGAHVTDLVRLASGVFRLEQAVTLDRFREAVKGGTWPQLLIPVDTALARRFPALRVDSRKALSLCSGQSIPASHAAEPKALARVYGADGRFLAIAAYDAVENVWRPKKVFVSPHPGPIGRGAD